MNTRLITSLCTFICLVAAPVSAQRSGQAIARAGEPGGVARKAAAEIRGETLLAANGPAGRPLPVVSHWNMGSRATGWTPQYQVELLDGGHHILPWLAWPRGDPDAKEQNAARFNDYYGLLLAYCRKLGLPICLRGTQWEAMLVRKEYRELPAEECPAVVTTEGMVIPKLSPFGPVGPWRDPAAEYVDTPAMRKLQQIYPDPPLVLFVSNNEAPDLRWHQVEQSARYLEKYGAGRPDGFKREVVSRGWMERYPVMFGAMREALVSDVWKKNVRFVGYGAFGPSHFGRWPGWKDYSLITNDFVSPDWHIWDGGSPSYYTHNWNDNRDHRVWSTQVQSMNWIFQLREAWSIRPGFWWEISIWDGNGSGWTPGAACPAEMLEKSKACQYIRDGQTYTPERYLGWVQFGLWLLRPRAVREFRGSTTALEPWRPFFEQLLLAVDRIYENRTLKEFWRRGKLVPNVAHEHPYQHEVPAKYRVVNRWFLLDTSLDPPRPWQLHTNLPVFSMALVLGESPRRRWLLYGHSPLEERRDVTIDVPGFGKITVDIPRRGAFYVVTEATRRIQALDEARSDGGS